MRYIIGIDLGTTNSCLCFVDTLDPGLSLQTFPVPQMNQFRHIENPPTLPSFCCLGVHHQLPWNKSQDIAIGIFAREEGVKTPAKLIESAKSWLCHSAANRREKILPFESIVEAEKMSPVEASANYLKHLKSAWNYAKAKSDAGNLFEEQDVILTVPASFDEAARALTVEAARLAGITQLTLLEEPQAAFYSWIAQHEKNWKGMFKSGDVILVCDIGGGTTDFSLIEVNEKNQELYFERMAVGDHLLLGGDNMDIALAKAVEDKLFQSRSHELTTTQWHQLRYQARKAKEILLNEKEESGTYRVLLQGTGASIVANTISAEISRQEVKHLLIDGFFPQLSWENALQSCLRSGVKTMGLPYENEPAITKHLAHFLKTSAALVKAPDYILFNGGVMKPAAFQNAILSNLENWFPEKKPQLLDSINLDLAVSKGAAYYGKVRRGLGVRIGGGSARGYYLGLDVVDESGKKMTKALTLLPRGSEEGDQYEPEQTFMLRPNVPVSFTIHTSHVRLHDKSGDLLDIEDKELHALPAIHTILRFGKNTSNNQPIPVKLGISLTAIGTIDLWLQAKTTPHRWTLEFQLRTQEGKQQTSMETQKDETFDSSFLIPAKEAIAQTFSKNSKSDILMEHLEELIGQPRKEWSPSLLRGLFEEALKQEPQKRNTVELESRWWNLIGFLLRPGFGYPLDDHRIKELWKIFLADSKSTRSLDVGIQQLICMRRIAGGFNRGQQAQIAAELWPQLIDKKTGKILLKGRGDLYLYTERLRTAASLELVENKLKIKLGEAILSRQSRESPLPIEHWALGRLGSRHLFYGSLVNVIPKEVASAWIEKLILQKSRTDKWLFAIEQIARKSDQREINLPINVINKIIEACKEEIEFDRIKKLLTDVTALTKNEQDKVFGENLPTGLVLQL